MQRVVSPLIAFALALTIAASGTAGTSGDLHAEGGFADAKLGEPIESFVGLELIGRDPTSRTETYIRRSDDLQVGGAEVEGITYSFYAGRLYFISVQMTGRRNAESVLAALERAFGSAIVTGSRPNERIWPGGKVFVLYDLDPKTQRGMAAMTSTPIHARMRTDRGAVPAPIVPGR